MEWKWISSCRKWILNSYRGPEGGDNVCQIMWGCLHQNYSWAHLYKYRPRHVWVVPRHTRPSIQFLFHKSHHKWEHYVCMYVDLSVVVWSIINPSIRALHMVRMGAHSVYMGAQCRPNGRPWAQNVGLCPQYGLRCRWTKALCNGRLHKILKVFETSQEYFLLVLEYKFYEDSRALEVVKFWHLTTYIWFKEIQCIFAIFKITNKKLVDNMSPMAQTSK